MFIFNPNQFKTSVMRRINVLPRARMTTLIDVQFAPTTPLCGDKSNFICYTPALWLVLKHWLFQYRHFKVQLLIPEPSASISCSPVVMTSVKLLSSPFVAVPTFGAGGKRSISSGSLKGLDSAFEPRSSRFLTVAIVSQQCSRHADSRLRLLVCLRRGLRQVRRLQAAVCRSARGALAPRLRYVSFLTIMFRPITERC